MYILRTGGSGIMFVICNKTNSKKRTASSFTLILHRFLKDPLFISILLDGKLLSHDVGILIKALP